MQQQVTWDAQAFLQKYREIKSRGIAANYYAIKQLRVDEFFNTIQLVRQGHYTTPSGKIVTLPDGTTMQQGTVFYDSEFTVSAPDVTDSQVQVINSDCMAVGISLALQGHRPAILNMASRSTPGGGVVRGAGAQEEGIFRRTDLFRSLYQFAPFASRYGIKRSVHQYPLHPTFGGIYTPGATIFRYGESRGYELMEQPVAMSFISVAAINHPDLEGDKIAAHQVPQAKDKMRTILRIGLKHGHDALVLGALGCGAFCNPPRHVARLFHEVLQEPEFSGKIPLVVFAILDDHNAHRGHNPQGNYLPFAQEFQQGI